ncbi:hypothetical protein AS361_15070 [Myroides marinus]|uniref:Ig-like domain-containing protein n=1 Tax=Myroides marinus TaxID=703342 RepID=UPI000741DC1E|nr:Ig-like domain-containing protein [Myroides marinus]KUF45145.1 hypothetical protein AS361_15070 [Myroides marinus]
MNIRITLLMIFSFLLFNCSSDDKKEIIEKSIVLEFKEKQKQIFYGDRVNLMSELTVENIDLGNLLWHYSNSDILYIKEYNVQAISQGETTVTVTDKTTGKKASLKIVVSMVSISFKQEQVVMNVKDSETLDLKEYLVLENTTFDNVQWISYDSSAAYVSNGVVTALKDTEFYIGASIKDFGGAVTISVKSKGFGVHSIYIYPKDPSDQIKVNETYQYILQLEPYDTDRKDLTFSSSNPSVFQVNQNGEVRGISEGMATLTVKAINGVSSSRDIQVVSGFKSIELSLGQSFIKGRLPIGQNAELILRSSSNSIKTSDVDFISDNPSIATVDQNGIVKGLKRGKVTITATTKDNPLVKSSISFIVLNLSAYVNTSSYLSTSTGKALVSYNMQLSDDFRDAIKITDFKVHNTKGVIQNDFQDVFLFNSQNKHTYHFEVDTVKDIYVTYKIQRDEHIEERKEYLNF